MISSYFVGGVYSSSNVVGSLSTFLVSVAYLSSIVSLLEGVSLFSTGLGCGACGIEL